jgi:hypothetical protein
MIARVGGMILACMMALASAGLAQTSGQSSSTWDAYRSASTCVAAMERIMHATRWGERRDTLRLDPAAMLPEPAVTAGKTCMRKFMPAGAGSVAIDQVESMFLLARATGQHALADTLFERAMGRQRIRADSVELLWHAVSAWGTGSPADLARSRAIAVRLDRLGVIGERIMWPVDDHWESQHDSPRSLAFALLDTAALKSELRLEEAVYERLPDSALAGAEGVPVNIASTDLLLTLLRDPQADSAVLAMAARADEVLGPREEGEWGGAMKLMGKPFGPVTPDLWFNRNPADSVLPRPGRVTLVQYVDPQHCQCDGLYSSIRRLKRRFGDSLDFLLLTQSHRHFGDHVALDPAAEAKLVSAKLLEKEKLDVTVAFWKTPFSRHPDPDRRIVPERVGALHDIRFGTGALVVDRRGRLMSAGIVQISPWGDLALVRLLESLLSGLPAT